MRFARGGGPTQAVDASLSQGSSRRPWYEARYAIIGPEPAPQRNAHWGTTRKPALRDSGKLDFDLGRAPASDRRFNPQTLPTKYG